MENDLKVENASSVDTQHAKSDCKTIPMARSKPLKVVVLCGNANVGKTTTLHMLACLLENTPSRFIDLEGRRKSVSKILSEEVYGVFEINGKQVLLNTKGDNKGEVGEICKDLHNNQLPKGIHDIDVFVTAVRVSIEKFSVLNEIDKLLLNAKTRKEIDLFLKQPFLDDKNRFAYIEKLRTKLKKRGYTLSNIAWESDLSLARALYEEIVLITK